MRVVAHIEPAKVQQAFADLGVHPNDLQALARIPFPESQQKLADLKDLARRNFRRLSLELHPDRNGGDEAKTERFKTMSRLRDELEKIEVQPAPVAPRPVPQHPRGVNPFQQSPFGPGAVFIGFPQAPPGTRPTPGWIGRVPVIIIVR